MAATVDLLVRSALNPEFSASHPERKLSVYGKLNRLTQADLSFTFIQVSFQLVLLITVIRLFNILHNVVDICASKTNVSKLMFPLLSNFLHKKMSV